MQLQEKPFTAEEINESLLKQRFASLKSCRIFRDIPAKQLKRILHLVKEKTIPAGEEIIRQDTAGDYFFILVSGQAEVCRNGDYGEKITLAMLEQGETFGEMGYFSDGWRTASVYAREKCELLQISYQDLDSMFREAPVLARNFLDMITGRLRRTNLRFQETTEKGRLAERNLDSLNRFLDMSEIAALSSGIDGLIERIVLTARKVMEAERVSLFLVDMAAGELWSKVAEGMGYREIRIPLNQGIVGWVAAHGEVVNIPDAYQDERFDKSVDGKTGFKTKNILCGPIKNLKGEIVGVIEVINKATCNYGEREQSLFKAFTYQTAVALENFYLYRRLVNSHQQMAIMLDVNNAVSRILDRDALIITIVSKICEILEAERGTLFLLDEEKNELWSKVALGKGMKEIRVPALSGLAGHVVQTGEVLNIEDAYRDERFNPLVDKNTGFQTRNVLCMPVVNRDGKIIGVTEIINKKKGHFAESDIRLLKALTSQIVIALDNAELYHRALSLKNYLASVQDSISNSIVTLDEQSRVVTANRAAASLFDWSSDSAGKIEFTELLGRGNEKMLEHLRQVRLDGRPLADYDLDLVLHDGRHHTVNVNFFSLTDSHEQRKGVVLVFEDVSQEKRLKSTLTRYMSRDIVERILNDPQRQTLGGIRSKATIMFTDIRGFTGIAESLSAEKTVEFLNQYFSVMADVIFANGGVLDKYIGDGIMAVFGVPYAHENDPERALRTALQMRNSLASINSGRTAAGLEPIRMGMGLCSGEVVSGNIGSEKRMDYTVIGNEVNIAARLEKLSGYYGLEILIGGEIVNQVKNSFTIRPIDLAHLKGKKNPVYIYEVLSEGRRELTGAEECFSRGLVLYRRKDFTGAARAFAEGCPADNLCRIFLNRCRNLIKNAPPDDWDGAWIFDEKSRGQVTPV